MRTPREVSDPFPRRFPHNRKHTTIRSISIMAFTECPTSPIEVGDQVMFNVQLSDTEVYPMKGKVLGIVYNYDDYWLEPEFKQGYTYYIEFFDKRCRILDFYHSSEIQKVWQSS
jgi:hypothetical protein